MVQTKAHSPNQDLTPTLKNNQAFKLHNKGYTTYIENNTNPNSILREWYTSSKPTSRSIVTKVYYTT